FLAAFAGVRLAADPVHRDRKRGVRLARDRAERHRAGGETPDDVLRRFDLVERHGLALVLLGILDAEQAADGQKPLRLFIQDLGVGPITVVRIAAHRVLQQRYRLRGPGVILAARAVGILAADVERGLVDRRVAERIGVAAHRLFGDLAKSDAFYTRVRAG